MKKFPLFLKPENAKAFKALYISKTTLCIRKELFSFLIKRKSEEEYVSLNDFVNKYDLTLEEIKKIVDSLLPELSSLGWNFKYSYGDTGVFIYGKDKPKSCW